MSSRVTAILFGCSACPEGHQIISKLTSIVLSEHDLDILEAFRTQPITSFSGPDQARLRELLGSKLECSTHGRQALGYSHEYQTTVVAEFEIPLE